MVRRRACWAALVMESASSRMMILCLWGGCGAKKQSNDERRVNYTLPGAVGYIFPSAFATRWGGRGREKMRITIRMRRNSPSDGEINLVHREALDFIPYDLSIS